MKMNYFISLCLFGGLLWAQEPAQELVQKSDQTSIKTSDQKIDQESNQSEVVETIAPSKAVPLSSEEAQTVDSIVVAKPTAVVQPKVSTAEPLLDKDVEKAFQKSVVNFTVLTPPDRSVLIADTMVLSGTGPKGLMVDVRGYQSIVDSANNWSVKLPSPKVAGRYSFSIKLMRDSQVVDELRWRIEKIDQELAYALDSMSQSKELQSNQEEIISKGDLVYFIPTTNDLSFLGMGAWRDAQIEQSKEMKVRYVHPDTMSLPKVLGTQRECTEVNCASLFSNFNNVPYAVMGRVMRTDKDYLVELQVLRVSDQNIVKVFRKNVVKNKVLAMDALDKLGADLNLWVREVLTSQIVPPEDLRIIQERERILKRQREIAAINGTHLEGSDLPDILYKSQSPYVISRSMVVPAGKLIVVEPGVTFLMYGKSTEIQVFGQLDARGTVEDPIRFVSSKSNPEVGDWGGMVIQSPYTSQFDYIEFQHSKNGVQVVNSSANFYRAIFRRNHFQAIRAINSDVYIDYSEIRGGHLTGVYSESYSQLHLNDSKITENENGVTVNDYGIVEVKRSDIYRNDYGIVLLDSVSAKFVNTNVRDNRIGFASTTYFKNLKSEDGFLSFKSSGYSGVSSNVDNFVHLNKEQMNSIASKLSQKNQSQLLLSENRVAAYKGELIAVDSETAEFNINNMGNISAGLAYHNVDQAKNTTKRVQDFNGEYIYPGHKYPNDKQIQGYAAYASAYTLTEINEHALELTLDGVYDDSTGVFTKPTTLRYTHPDRSIVLGDMNESAHELILSSRDVMGVKYVENGAVNRAGQHSWKATVLWGESARPLDEGQHNPEFFFDEAWPGNARTQEILTMGKLSYQKNPNLRMDFGMVHTQEKRDDLLFFRDDLKQKSILGEPMVQAQSAFTEWDYVSNNQVFRLNVAMIHGSSDSLDIARDLAIDRWLEERNIVELADYLKEELKRKPAPNPAYISDYLPFEYAGNAYSVIAEVDQYEASIRDSLEQLTFYGFRKSVQSWGGQTQMELNLGATNLFARAQFMGTNFYSPGSPNLNNNSRAYELSWNQVVTNWWESFVRYGAYVENASSNESHMNLMGYGEGTFFGFSKDLKETAKLDVNRIQPKYSQNASLEQIFYLPKDIDLEVSYNFNHDRQHNSRVLEKDTSLNAGVYTDPYFKGTGTILRHYGEEVDVNSQRWEDFASLSDTLATGFIDESQTHYAASHVRWKYNRSSSIRLGGSYSWYTDKSAFKYADETKGLNFNDKTWGILGYYYGGNNYTQIEIPLTWTGHFDLWKNRTTVKYLQKNYEVDNETASEYSLSNSFSYDAIPEKLTVAVDFGLRSKSTEYDTDRFYFVDTTGATDEKLYYYVLAYASDGTLVSLPQSEDSYWAQDVYSSAEASSEYELRKEKSSKLREEFDYYLGTTIKYNINSKFYTEVFARYDEFQRPQDLNEEFTDLYTGARVNYSF